MAYTHTNKKGTTYYLNSQGVTLRGSGKKQTIYYFTREVRKTSMDKLPDDFKVVENQKTGLPTLKRK